jgi:hypothetical protein
MKNEDALQDLKIFYRSTGKLLMKADQNGIIFTNSTGSTMLFVGEDNIDIETNGKDGEYGLELKPYSGTLKLSKGKSELIFEKNNLKLQVDGDINITSRKGNVNIKGKKVNLNE